MHRVPLGRAHASCRRARSRSEYCAASVAARCGRDHPWPRSDKTHAIALSKAADLAEDLELREQFADELEAYAGRGGRWRVSPAPTAARALRFGRQVRARRQSGKTSASSSTMSSGSFGELPITCRPQASMIRRTPSTTCLAARPSARIDSCFPIVHVHRASPPTGSIADASCVSTTSC